MILAVYALRPRRLVWLAALLSLLLPVAIHPALPAAPARADTTLTVASVEHKLLGVASAVQGAHLSAAQRSALLSRLGVIAGRLQTAEGLAHRLDGQNEALDALLGAQIDAAAAINRIGADLQINLDQLNAAIDATVNADITATIGGITTTVHGSAEQIQATLNANARQLIVDITADLNIVKVITLHARGHVDARRLAVSLNALVTRLTLDLSAVAKDLQILATADVKAALTAEAQIRAQLTAQLNGLRTQVLAGINTRIRLQKDAIARTQSTLDSLLTSISSDLNTIQSSL